MHQFGGGISFQERFEFADVGGQGGSQRLVTLCLGMAGCCEKFI